MAAVSFETGHLDIVHDVQFDYYGKRVATCSSDKTIKVFEVQGDRQALLADLVGHEGPVWQVAWAHPKYGSVLASCSFDHRVIVWKETAKNQWTQVYQSGPSLFQGSVNALSWAPYELGLVLACGSSDGSIAILSYDGSSGTGNWEVKKIPSAHPLGCLGISWGPAVPLGSLVNGAAPSAPIRKFASGGCDKTVKVWRQEGSEWVEDQCWRDHREWVRDVAWAPSLGLPSNTIASCSQDGRVIVHGQDQPNGPWTSREVCVRQGGAWRLSWSVTGDVLAVSDGSNEVTLWKEAVDHTWQQLA